LVDIAPIRHDSLAAATRRRRRHGRIASLWRLCRYRLVIPVFRSPHPPEFTARGVANGVFWGVTPTMGLQTMEIVGTWFIARRWFKRDSSLVQALIWVWVNNPLTMLPMYYAFYVTGMWMMGTSGATGYDDFVALWDTAGGTWWTRVTTVVEAIGVPLVLGSLPYAVVATAISYRWAARVVRARRLRIAARSAV
jgi:uncharacterized protein (DUF2062 family)